MFKIPSSSFKTPKKLKLSGASDLFECERILSCVNRASTPTVLTLPKDDRRLFLKDLRVVAIISAAARNAHVQCKWRHNISAANHDSLLGLAGTVFGVPPIKGHRFASLDEAKYALARGLNILEDPPSSKETLTICVIDETTRSQPVALSALSEKAKFIDDFGNCVSTYFDLGPSEGFSSRIRRSLLKDGSSVEECIYGFVHELYQNAFNHGSLDEDQKTIPGLRLIRLRKRISHGNWLADFLQEARQFTELEEYLRETAPQNKPFKFYEISISDNGMGILSRFRAVRDIKSHKDSSPCENLQLLNQIVAKSLSSDARKSNIGQGGLQKALSAVNKIQGFVSLRTDNLWVYRSPVDAKAVSEDEWLKLVANEGDLSTIPGTHFSMIVPAI